MHDKGVAYSFTQQSGMTSCPAVPNELVTLYIAGCTETTAALVQASAKGASWLTLLSVMVIAIQQRASIDSYMYTTYSGSLSQDVYIATSYTCIIIYW